MMCDDKRKDSEGVPYYYHRQRICLAPVQSRAISVLAFEYTRPQEHMLKKLTTLKCKSGKSCRPYPFVLNFMINKNQLQSVNPLRPFALMMRKLLLFELYEHSHITRIP